MGLIGWRKFSSIPTFQKRAAFRTQQREVVDTQISNDFFSFVINNGIRISEAVTVTNSSVTVYTVPEGKIFYLISVEMSESANIASGTGFIQDGDNNTLCGLSLRDGGEAAVSTSFSIPFLYKEGESLKVVSITPGLAVFGLILGYEIEAKQEKQKF